MEQHCKKKSDILQILLNQKNQENVRLFERTVMGHGMVCMSKKECIFLRFKVKIAFISVWHQYTCLSWHEDGDMSFNYYTAEI